MKMNNMKQELVSVLKKLNSEQWESITDGHTTFKETFYTKMGFPEEFVKNCVETIKSDGTYMGSVWKDEMKAIVTIRKIQEYKREEDIPEDLVKEFNENFISEQRCVYSLTFLRRLAHKLGVEYESCMGRGREARYIVTALQKSLKVELTCDF